MPSTPTTSAGRDHLVRFLFVVALAFGLWQLLYSLVLHPWGGLDRWLIDSLTWLSGLLLRLLGYELLPEPTGDVNRYIGVQGGHHLWIGDRCDGLTVMVVFLIFIAAFPGPWKHKPWFMLVGLAAIHLINAVRVAALCIVVTIDYELLNFNHDYTFQIVVYSVVLLLWYIWVKRFAPLPSFFRTS